jgi:tRNA nucleotidyltransferase/poly(A) polymerase
VTEVATFRSDGAYSDGRHPDAVRFSTSPEEDVKRRDFTINGMMLDPECLPDGQTQPVLDFVGGMQDLHAGLIRAIGDPGERFAEDKLRMLRGCALRRASPSIWSRRRRWRSSELAPAVSQVSRERVREELTRMLTEGHARRAFELLDATGLLARCCPKWRR